MHRIVDVAKIVILLGSLLSSLNLVWSQTVPAGFSVLTVNANLNGDAVGFALLPDERILVVHQFSGQVQVIVNGILKSAPLLTVPDLETSFEKGLLGIAVDPDFPTAPYIYLFHTHNSSTNRVSRFTMAGDLNDPNSDNLIINPGSQFTLIEDMPANAFNHNGGTIRFGSDKTLYISHGDDADSGLVQDLTTLNGKILRINRDGNIPANNPAFPNEPSGKRREIFAFGLRNPFRFCIDPANDQLFIGDVGQSTKEEFDLATGGENFGWPRQEGSVIFDANVTVIQPDPVFPIWEYDHLPGDNSAIALAVYRQQNFGNDFSFPAEYDGTFFYADFYHDWMRNIRTNGNGGWTSVDFATGFSNPVDGALATDGSLYLLEHGQAIKRIIYNVAVPVELSSFSAQAFPDKVVLIWTTETETNNFGFEVHKSFDGDKFDVIGFVNGSGTVTQRMIYSFEDETQLFGTMYYHLKQVDLDGSFEFSDVISVQFSDPTELVLEQSYPNPFNGNTRIVFMLPANNLKGELTQHTLLEIYDVQGRKVKTIIDGEMLPGVYQVEWQAKGQNGQIVSSGLYIYQITFGEFSQTKKLLFVK